MADTANTLPAHLNFPSYEYSYNVKSLLFSAATIEVEYIPKNENLTNFTLFVPILANFDPTNLTDYVDTWAPKNKWFAQEMILTHSESLVGANTNITVS
jgi:hypothetical protein